MLGNVLSPWGLFDDKIWGEGWKERSTFDFVHQNFKISHLGTGEKATLLLLPLFLPTTPSQN